MRYFITGGLGFIGTNFIKRLVKDDKNFIINVDYKSKFSMSNLKKNLNNYKFIKCDISKKKKIEQLIFQYKPNVIVNFAAESHVDRSISSPNKFIVSNILGTYSLIEASKKYLESRNNNDSFFKFIHISTDEVYGSLSKKGKAFDEKSNYKPNSPYSASKASSDFLVRSWFETYNLPAIITNCSNNYGPWQHPEKLIPKTIMNAIEQKNIPIYGKGENIRDWIFVDDHINAILLLIKKGKDGNKYNIGSYQEFTNIQIVNKICEYLDKVKPINKSYSSLIKFVSDRKGHDFRYAINSNKIEKECNFKSKYSFEKGLKITIDWYIKNFDYIKSLNKK
tara:strand:+ start:88 stop:1095 length:1008 start_codon:yes stop_codon:yes gene_type:complete